MSAAVVIPCFNEERRLDVDAIGAGAELHNWHVVLVDDGSTDGTYRLIQRLQQLHPDAISAVRMPSNVGKGEAVRRGMRTALESDGIEIVAYLDADLATPVDEMARIVDRLRQDNELEVVLGSRILYLGMSIRRSLLRHLVGRVYATGAAMALGVGVYDTQCGAKAFRRTPHLLDALTEPFVERWSFDVELLSRLTRHSPAEAWTAIVEEPVRVWGDRPGSKLNLLAALRATVELARIGYRHRWR